VEVVVEDPCEAEETEEVHTPEGAAESAEEEHQEEDLVDVEVEVVLEVAVVDQVALKTDEVAAAAMEEIEALMVVMEVLVVVDLKIEEDMVMDHGVVLKKDGEADHLEEDLLEDLISSVVEMLEDPNQWAVEAVTTVPVVMEEALTVMVPVAEAATALEAEPVVMVVRKEVMVHPQAAAMELAEAATALVDRELEAEDMVIGVVTVVVLEVDTAPAVDTVQAVGADMVPQVEQAVMKMIVMVQRLPHREAVVVVVVTTPHIPRSQHREATEVAVAVLDAAAHQAAEDDTNFRRTISIGQTINIVALNYFIRTFKRSVSKIKPKITRYLCLSLISLILKLTLYR